MVVTTRWGVGILTLPSVVVPNVRFQDFHQERTINGEPTLEIFIMTYDSEHTVLDVVLEQEDWREVILWSTKVIKLL